MREQLRIKRCYQREGKVEKKRRGKGLKKKKKALVVNLKKKKTGNDTLAFISFQGADVYVQPNGFPFFFSWRMYKMSKKHVSAF